MLIWRTVLYLVFIGQLFIYRNWVISSVFDLHLCVYTANIKKNYPSIPKNQYFMLHIILFLYRVVMKGRNKMWIQSHGGSLVKINIYGKGLFSFLEGWARESSQTHGISQVKDSPCGSTCGPAARPNCKFLSRSPPLCMRHVLYINASTAELRNINSSF